MLRLDNISWQIDQKNIIEPITLECNKGEMTAIMGESGSGKTALIKIISGAQQPSTGRILIDDRPLPHPDDLLMNTHKEIHTLAQDFELDPYKSVAENLRIQVLQLEASEIDTKVDEWLTLTELEHAKDQMTHTLSGGQKQRLSWACSLIDMPDFLLMDEPTNQLHASFSHSILSRIKDRIRQKKNTVVWATHDADEVMMWADRLLVIRAGKILRDDVPAQVYDHPNSLYEARLFGIINTVNDQWYRPHELNVEKDKNGAYKIRHCTYCGSYYILEIKGKNNQQLFIRHNVCLNVGTDVHLRHGRKHIQETS